MRAGTESPWRLTPESLQLWLPYQTSLRGHPRGTPTPATAQAPGAICEVWLLVGSQVL